MNVFDQECDFECERSLKRILFLLRDEFKDHYLLHQTVVSYQRSVIEELIALCQQFLILTKGTLCVHPYPKSLEDVQAREIIDDFNEKKKLLLETSQQLTSSLQTIKQTCVIFDRALQKIDASVPSRIIYGDENREPIYYYIELFADLFKFFRQLQNKMNMLGRFLLVEDMGFILEYKQLLEPDKQFNNYLEKCLCMTEENKDEL